MKLIHKEFLEDTENAMAICNEIEFILIILRDYCEYNEDTNQKFLGLTLMSKLLLEKNRRLYNHIDKAQRDICICD